MEYLCQRFSSGGCNQGAAVKILLLEDDVVLCDVIEEYLGERYEVGSCFSTDAALEMIQREDFDLFVFDVNVIGSMNGIELLRSLRSFKDATPAIIITAYTDMEHLKKAFGSGANDFIRKPFELEELGMRIENLKKLFKLEDWIEIDEDLLFFPESNMLLKENERVRLSAKDAAILHYLLKNSYRSVSSEELIQNLWEFDSMPSEATLRSHIRTIRNIIAKECIETVRGVGYRWTL